MDSPSSTVSNHDYDVLFSCASCCLLFDPLEVKVEIKANVVLTKEHTTLVAFSKCYYAALVAPNPCTSKFGANSCLNGGG